MPLSVLSSFYRVGFSLVPSLVEWSFGWSNGLSVVLSITSLVRLYASLLTTIVVNNSVVLS